MTLDIQRTPPEISHLVASLRPAARAGLAFDPGRHGPRLLRLRGVVGALNRRGSTTAKSMPYGPEGEQTCSATANGQRMVRENSASARFCGLQAGQLANCAKQGPPVPRH